MALSALAAALVGEARAKAQPTAQGFATERLYLSAPGAGWVVMDDLAMHGGLGGAVAVTTGYASDPLRVTDGEHRMAVVSNQAFADFGLAVAEKGWRFYVNLTAPVATGGEGNRDGNVIGAYRFVAPALNLGNHPDTMSDPRIGFDARLLGEPRSAFRLGAGVQAFLPNGDRSDYDTDGTLRAMGRVLVAGDAGRFTYAGHLGIHVRPLDDAPVPGSPRGSEALFGIAAGRRFVFGSGDRVAVVVGTEIYGETAFHSFLAPTATGIEGLLSGRVEGTRDDRPKFRIKLAGGGGLNPRFGAPEWRVVFGLELSGHAR